MKLIVISFEEFFEQEAKIVCSLFEAGLLCYHLRKPQSEKEEIRRFLERIPQKFHNRIVLHEHFSLLDEFDLKGIHLNRRHPVPYEKAGISVSKSCHSLEEVKTEIDAFDYVFLSPVFDSISKTGYKKAFSETELMKAKQEHIINEKVIALGGITPDNITQVRSYGFGGVAVLGGIWSDFETSGVLQRFENYKKCILDEECKVNYIVIEKHKTNYPNPIMLKAGEKVIIGEEFKGIGNEESWTNWVYCKKIDGSNEGWVPKQIIKYDSEIIIQDYSAKELNVEKGAIVEGEKELNGWLWSRNTSTNETGWIPIGKIKLIN